MEIISKGTKYEVRIEERKLNSKPNDFQYQDVIATKSGIIKEVQATQGEIVKNTNDYVQAGDVIISGTITKPDNTVVNTPAKGKVTAQTWYNITVYQPLTYQEENLTGKAKELYVINFLNKRISLFDYNKYNTFSKDVKVLLKDQYNILSFTKEKQYELDVIDEVYTTEVAVVKALNKAQTKLREKTKCEEIVYEKVLNVSQNENIIVVKIFYNVIENIGVVKKVDN